MTISALLFFLSSVCWIAGSVACPKGQCGNVTIYLGPRWGTKVLKYVKYPQVRESTVSVSTEGPPTTNHQGDEPAHRPSTAWRSVPIVRPITYGNYMKVDYYDDEHERSTESWHPTAKTPNNIGQRRQIILDMTAFYYHGLINFTEAGLSGDELKDALSQVRPVQNDDNTVVSRVTRLYLGHNHINQLPSLVFPVYLEYSLHDLRLDNNPISFLSAATRFEISRLANLKILSLANTGLRYLENLYTHSLEVLDLSDNRLLNVPFSLIHLQDLQELYLDNNHISTLYDIPFTSLRDLRVLSLSGNYISQIWDTPFLNLNYLHKLKLNNNSLAEMEQVSVNAMTKVYLGGNPMRCSCQLMDATRKSWPDIVDKDNLTCFTSDRDNLKLVHNLIEENLLDCSNPWRWFWSLCDKLEGVILWLQRHDAALVIIVVCALIASFLMILLVRRWRSLKTKFMPKKVPYNILDDNLLP